MTFFRIFIETKVKLIIFLNSATGIFCSSISMTLALQLTEEETNFANSVMESDQFKGMSSGIAPIFEVQSSCDYCH